MIDSLETLYRNLRQTKLDYCAMEFNDANYTNWEDPFAPEYEIVWHHIEMGPVWKPNKYNYVISQGFWFPEDK